MKNDIADRDNVQDLFEKVTQKARKGKFMSKKALEKFRKTVSDEVVKAIEVAKIILMINLSIIRMVLLTLSEKILINYLCIIFLEKNLHNLLICIHLDNNFIVLMKKS